MSSLDSTTLPPNHPSTSRETNSFINMSTEEPSFSELPISPNRFSFSEVCPPSPPSPFHSTPTPQDQPSTNRPTNSLFRSISLKVPSNSELPPSPPRLSFAGICPPLHPSPPSSPRRSPPSTKPKNFQSSYQCISSMLKKDGRILSIAECNGLVYTGSESSCIRIWKLPEFTECGRLKTKSGMVCALAVSNDWVFGAYSDCKIRVWRRSWDGIQTHVRVATIPKIGSYIRNYIAGKDTKMIKHLGPITSLAISVSDDLLYSASADSTVKVWRISDLKCIETIQAHSGAVNDVIVSNDSVLYTASDDASIKVWRRSFCSSDRQHALTVTLPAKNSPVKALTLTTDGGVLYGGCTDGYIHYWLRGRFSGQLQYGGAINGHTHAVMCLANAENYMVSGSADLTSRVWVRERDCLHTCLAVLQGHRGPIRCVMVFTDGAAEDGGDRCTVCTGSLDGTLKVWQVTVTGKASRSSMQSDQDYFEL